MVPFALGSRARQNERLALRQLVLFHYLCEFLGRVNFYNALKVHVPQIEQHPLSTTCGFAISPAKKQVRVNSRVGQIPHKIDTVTLPVAERGLAQRHLVKMARGRLR